MSHRHQIPVMLPRDWISDRFQTPSNPFVLDVGCGKGTWALQYASVNTSVNVVGVDIRDAIVDLANDRSRRAQVDNVHYITSNANVDMSRLLKDISHVSKVQMVAIHFPDPHFKKRNHKRRLVNTEFITALSFGLAVGTKVT